MSLQSRPRTGLGVGDATRTGAAFPRAPRAYGVPLAGPVRQGIADVLSPLVSAWWLLLPGLFAAAVGSALILRVRGLGQDDAYIFARYLENLARGRGLAFNPDDLSFAATSIGWLLLLWPLRLVWHWDPLILMRSADVALYLASGMLVSLVTLRICGSRFWAALAGVLFVVNPMVVKEATSGMETMLNTAVFLAIVLALPARSLRRRFGLGLLAGAYFLVRPEGLLAFLLVAAIAVLRLLTQVRRPPRHALGPLMARLLGAPVAGFLLVAAPWPLFVLAKTGRLLPSTYEGKLATYAPQVLSAGLPRRLLESTKVFLADAPNFLAQDVFLPVAAAFFLSCVVVYQLARRRDDVRLNFMALYFVGLPVVFALTFPLGTSQRYMAPLLVIPYIFGGVAAAHIERSLAGFGTKRQSAGRSDLRKRALRSAAVGLLIVSLPGILLAGSAYRSSAGAVADFDTPGSIYAAARWLDGHAAPSDKVAAEPIGAIAYFSDRYVVDLGGLTDPDIWPLLEAGAPPGEAICFLQARGAAYLLEREREGRWSIIARDHPDVFRLAVTFPSGGAGDVQLFRLDFSRAPCDEAGLTAG